MSPSAAFAAITVLLIRLCVVLLANCGYDTPTSVPRLVVTVTPRDEYPAEARRA
jgi:hypothetical protein